MDSRKLKETYPHLVTYMEENGYSRSYIRSIMAFVRKVISMDGNDSITSYEDLYHSMDSAHGCLETPQAFRARRNRLSVVRNFDLFDKLPDRRSRSTFLSKSSFSRLSPHYKELIDIYRCHAEISGKNRRTIASEITNGSCFFLHLMNAGAETIDKATMNQISSFFHDGNATKRGHSYRKNVKAILSGNRNGPYAGDCARVMDLLPCTRQSRKNFPYLKDEEAELLHSYIMDANNGERIRDRLMTALAYFYGLRGTDIARFCYDWIDWDRDEIVITQSKTGERLVLPLLASVGNMVIDMVKSFPEKKGPVPMFTSLSCRNSMLEGRSLINVVSSFMKSAGVRTDGGMVGLRVLRHHAATTLIRNGVRTPVISSILGHVSPESIVPYVDSSTDELRSCAIDMSEFPIRNELFDLW